MVLPVPFEEKQKNASSCSRSPSSTVVYSVSFTFVLLIVRFTLIVNQLLSKNDDNLLGIVDNHGENISH